MTYRKTTVRVIRPALLTFLSAVVLLLSFGSVAHASAKGRTAAAKPTVVLVHGAWADGSSWAGVAKDLQARGYTVDVPSEPAARLALATARTSRTTCRPSRVRSCSPGTPTEEQSSPTRRPTTAR